jgi:hypothetical protein
MNFLFNLEFKLKNMKFPRTNIKNYKNNIAINIGSQEFKIKYINYNSGFHKKMYNIIFII